MREADSPSVNNIRDRKSTHEMRETSGRAGESLVGVFHLEELSGPGERVVGGEAAKIGLHPEAKLAVAPRRLQNSLQKQEVNCGLQSETIWGDADGKRVVTCPQQSL